MIAVMTVVAVIPARWGSSRLPGKPLCDLGGEPMIRWVHRLTSQAALVDRVLVATDDRRIARAVTEFGGEVVMTSPDHPNGTSRVLEALGDIPCDGVVNVQGDEPFMDPALVDQVARCLKERPEFPMISLRHPLASEDESNPDRVKVVVDRYDRALYFSRLPIPYRRQKGAVMFGHIGIYGYRRDFLSRYVNLESTPLSESESLEQLRVLESGYTILVPLAKGHHGFGIDSPADLERARALIREERV